jgi:hypothetical protein
MFFGYLYIQKLDVKFNKKADLLEKKIIGGYNMLFAAEEFKQLKRMALNRKNQERLYQLRRLFVSMYGHFIK